MYAKMHRLDPIFAFEGTDPNALEESLKNFAVSERIAARYFSSSEQSALVPTHYPLSLAYTLARTERARIALLNTPNIRTALWYHFNLIRSLHAYAYFSIQTSTFFYGLNPAQAGFLGGQVSAVDIANKIAHSRSAVQKNIEAESQRLKCLLFQKKACTEVYPFPYLSNYPATMQVPEVSATARLNRVLLEELSTTRDNIPTENITTEERTIAPMIAVYGSTCFPYANPTLYIAWTAHSRMRGTKSVHMTFVNDLLFNKYQNVPNEYAQNLVRAGISYEYQPMNPYLCIDYIRDISQVLRAYYVRDALRIQPLFASSSEVRFSDIAKRERDIVNERDVLAFAEVEGYLQASVAILRKEGEEGLSTYIGAEQVRTLEHLARIWGTSPNYDLVIGAAEDSFYSAIVIRQQHKGPLFAYAASRLHIGTTLMLHNETLTYPYESLLKDNILNEEVSKYIARYEHDLKSVVPRAELKNYLLKTNSLWKAVTTQMTE